MTIPSLRTLFVFFACLAVLVLIPYRLSMHRSPLGSYLSRNDADAAPAAQVPSTFLYTFNTDGTLEEAGSMGDTTSPYFWLNSGAYLMIQNGLGKTVQGGLSLGDSWRSLYSSDNALDTGNGLFPQNLFRLVTRSAWTNDVQEMQFKIQHTNLTATPNRDGYSGILFFSRYHDGDNLYYAGIRMDGTSVIKKKIGGDYYTLDQETVFPGVYNKLLNPTLLPQKQWMRMRLVTQDLANGNVSLSLFLDKTNTGNYVQIAHAIDSNGAYGGTPVIKGPAYAGIRTDYMDVFFNDFKLTSI